VSPVVPHGGYGYMREYDAGRAGTDSRPQSVSVPAPRLSQDLREEGLPRYLRATRVLHAPRGQADDILRHELLEVIFRAGPELPPIGPRPAEYS
jgi:hypothetical protein